MSALRSLGPLAAAVVLLGIADSMAGSYLVLYASAQAKLSAVQTGVFMSAPAVGSIVASYLAGRYFDRRPSRLYALLAVIAGALGYGALLLTTSFVLMLIIGVVLLGAVGAAFPQLFALARHRMAGSPAEARAAPLLRSGWSLAWAIGPLLAAGLVASGGLDIVLAISAGVLVVTAVVVFTTRVTQPVAVQAEEQRVSAAPHPPAPFAVGLLTVSIGLFFTAMYAGSVALPLYVTTTMGRPASDIGLLYSACAIVEVLATVALALIPTNVNQTMLIVVSMVVFTGYFALTVTGRLELVAAGQVARGVGIAVVGAAGIRYFQDLNEAAVGRTTTLFANATAAGSLIAGVLAGISNQVLGYTSTLALCGIAALLAAVLFVIGHAKRRPPKLRPAASNADQPRAAIRTASSSGGPRNGIEDEPEDQSRCGGCRGE